MINDIIIKFACVISFIVLNELYIMTHLILSCLKHNDKFSRYKDAETNIYLTEALFVIFTSGILTMVISTFSNVYEPFRLIPYTFIVLFVYLLDRYLDDFSVLNNMSKKHDSGILDAYIKRKYKFVKRTMFVRSKNLKYKVYYRLVAYELLWLGLYIITKLTIKYV